MKRSYILVLCFLAFLLGESIASTVKLEHHAAPSSNSELLQTQSRSTTETETSSQTITEAATGTETETGCDPDCMFNYPYVEGGCKPPPTEPPKPPVTVEETFLSYEGEGPGEPIPEQPVIVTEEEGSMTIDYEEWVYEHTEEIFVPPVEEPPLYGEEGSIIVDYEGEGPSDPIPVPPVIIITEEEAPIDLTGETTYGETSEEIPFIPPVIQEEQDVYDEGIYESTEGSTSQEIPLIPPVIEEESGYFVTEPPKIEENPTDQPEKCVYTASLTSGVTHAYGQPTTYLTYTLHDDQKNQDVRYTYVLTTMYGGTVQTGDNDYVVYGTGAINFYNTYYGVNDYLTDKPGCSCVCGYSSYTFSYSFDF